MTRSTCSPCIDRALLICALVIASAVAPGLSWAQSDNEQRTEDRVATYSQAVERGMAKFKLGDYAGARDDLKRAYAIYPEPLLLFNIASTYRREGNRTAAIDYYGRFIAAAPDNHPKQAKARNTLKALLAEDSPAPDPATDAPAQSSPARGGQTAANRRTPALKPNPDPVPTDRNTSSGRTLRWTGIGLSVAALAGLGYTGFATQNALRTRSDLKDAIGDGTGVTWNEELDNMNNEFEKQRQRAIIASVVSGAALVTGVTLYLLGRQSTSDPRQESLSIVPLHHRNGTGLAITGTF